MKARYFLITFAVSFLTDSIGGNFTVLDDWYYSLIQPAWKPSDLVFPIVWTAIFSLCAVSGGILLNKASTIVDKIRLSACFLLNAGLNIIWSYLYFYIKRPDLAMLEVIFLWNSILLLLVVSRKLSLTATALLVPYLLWVTLATALNYQTAILNGYL